MAARIVSQAGSYGAPTKRAMDQLSNDLHPNTSLEVDTKHYQISEGSLGWNVCFKDSVDLSRDDFTIKELLDEAKQAVQIFKDRGASPEQVGTVTSKLAKLFGWATLDLQPSDEGDEKMSLSVDQELLSQEPKEVSPVERLSEQLKQSSLTPADEKVDDLSDDDDDDDDEGLESDETGEDE